MARCGAADGVKMFLAGGGLPDLHIELIKGGGSTGGQADNAMHISLQSV